MLKAIAGLAGQTLYTIYTTAIPTIVIDPTAEREFDAQIHKMLNKLIESEELAMGLKEEIKRKHGPDIARQISREILFTPIPHPTTFGGPLTATGTLASSIGVLDNDEAETPTAFVIGAQERQETALTGNPAVYGAVLEEGGGYTRDPRFADSQLEHWFNIHGFDVNSRYFIKKSILEEKGIAPRGWWSLIIENYELPKAIDETIEEYIVKLMGGG